MLKPTQIHLLFNELTNIGLKYKDIMKILKAYPDILISNRQNLIKKKIDLFKELKMSNYMIKFFIKEYPFSLLK